LKIYISADIEGVTGTTDWDETEKGEPAYAEFREQMTAEVAAACEGALDAGATEIWVKDAHDSARNLIAAKLPQEVKLVRGWSGHPFSMVGGLDETFQAAMMIGYHAPAASDANPLAHTMNRGITSLKINDQLASEFMLQTRAGCLCLRGCRAMPSRAGVQSAHWNVRSQGGRRQFHNQYPPAARLAGNPRRRATGPHRRFVPLSGSATGTLPRRSLLSQSRERLPCCVLPRREGGRAAHG